LERFDLEHSVTQLPFSVEYWLQHMLAHRSGTHGHEEAKGPAKMIAKDGGNQFRKLLCWHVVDAMQPNWRAYISY
jgi:hypothetical protein